MRSPTQRQRELADQIGLEVPKGITMAGMTDMLDRALEVKHRDESGRDDLPNEISCTRGVRSTPDWRVKAIQEFRNKGIRAGSIVDCSRGRAVVLGPNSRDVLLIHVLLLEGCEFAFQNAQSLEHVYTAPATHVHPFACRPFIEDKKSQNKKAKLLAFVDFATPKVLDSQKYRNEHGEFWDRAAAMALYQEFVERTTRPKAAKKTVPDRFCSFCGFVLKKRYATTWWNCGCRSEPVGPSEQLFCWKCRAPFTNDRGVRGNATWMCPACRPSRKSGCTSD